ncbi:MAG: NAD-dependent epimerase/dehydratase family protein [Thermoflexales bacterium]|nr:NAD-dependent epimerase/dehydratase family protein [Thermoflexales bacterium]MDW8350984.1 NAD-dependent epimerase/dehydratase family protein [Anaerolineae bacterium]
MTKRVIVTGGAGFVGSHVADAFLGAGYDVVVIDNLHSGDPANVPAQARFYREDIRDAAALERIFAAERPDLVSHQAALADVRQSLAFPDLYADVNIIGTIRLLEACRRHGVRKFIFASTGGAIYGESTRIPTPEDTLPRPLDCYGVSKLAGEHYLLSYKQNFGLDYCVLRYSNVYGPRQNAKGEAGVVAIFTTRMLRGEPVTIYGDGQQTRDFVYVEDVARANLMAVARGSGVYNIGTGVATDINTLFAHLARMTGYALPAMRGAAKAGEVRYSCLDPSQAWRELGWRATTSLADGLFKTVQAFAADHGREARRVTPA